MSSFRRKPAPHEIQTSVDQVVDALENGGFDKRATLVLGGAALAFAGIRPANDLDAMVPGAAFKEIEETRRTPGGLYVLRKITGGQQHHPFLQAHDTPLRPLTFGVDITYPHTPDNRQHPDYDREFLESLPDYDQVAGYRYLSPDQVLAHKKNIEWRLRRRKDRKDIHLIEQHLADKNTAE